MTPPRTITSLANQPDDAFEKHLAAHPPSSDSPPGPGRVVSATFLARWQIRDKTVFLFNLTRAIYCHTIRDTYHVGCTMDAVALRNLGVEVPPDDVLEGWVEGMTV